ncbi:MULTISPECIES: LacI family DNA-binding transcriptional regulator [unclassified Polaribacter]|uniref:LacI family DNA-binding transcriptional regulator n=1 Tax=unclassified Polaribacter TaxID=196858 RepID=UPI0011BF95CC|nr:MULTISPECIES: LacI family DNA-binding transcriptional regulator [unclassified Polaribacter]TXD53531.1 LacI family transcriptional regulator [Polaribacter sp. IC063]TXD58603.1 LacI family transcriptional regulator [Polaribacter sp. IC066]
MSNKEVTIHDIAEILGINSSTVSRALNNSTRVAKKTKDKVFEKAAELGYQRNHLASNLRKSKTFTLGVIVPRISRHFFSSAIAGIEETAFKAGYTVIICQSLESLEREESIINTLLSNRVDGVLVSISMETKNYDHLQGLKQRNIPFVFFDRHCDIANNSKVVIDDFEAAFNAVEHLIAQKSKNIAHFSGPQNLEIYKNRFKGYKAALEKHHILYREELVISSSLMEKDGATNVKKMLALPYKVDGLFCANDVVAISAIQYLKKLHIKIPEDIAIVGFSNESISSVIEPALTTVNQSGLEIGVASTNLLLDKISDKSKQQTHKTILVKTNLIVRKSSLRDSK